MRWLILAQGTTALSNLFKENVAMGVLDDIDTELVVLQAVTGQNLPRETYWHFRGTRRVGVCKEDVQMVCDCVWKGVSALCTRIRPNPDSGCRELGLLARVGVSFNEGAHSCIRS
jgi:hypothetical protein